ncbi:MAG: response regulator transcription factor [Nocardioidaceae bacterium]
MSEENVSVQDSRIRILIVDDDALVRRGLSMILGGSPDVEVVGEASDGLAALATVSRLKPHLVLMDIRMPRMDGITATSRILAGPHRPQVIVLTTFDADDQVMQALAAGASGFLLKDTPPAEIVDAVHRVANGEPMLSPSVTASLIRQVVSAPSGTGAAARTRLDALTEREREVAVAVGQGKANAEIASELSMSVATVKAHVSRLLMKLDATNRVQVALVVHDAGLV